MSLEFKAIIALIILVALGAGLWVVHHEIYESGYAAGIAEANKTAVKNQATNEKVHAAAEIAIAPIELKLQPEIDASLTTQPVTVSHVQAVIHDNPSFGAIVRPAAVDSVRQTQLEALRRAAVASPFPAPSSSSGLRSAPSGSAQLAALRHGAE